MSVAPIAQNTEAVVWRCSVKKVLDILEISLQITYTRVSLFFFLFFKNLYQMFFCEFCEISNKNFFYRTLLVAAFNAFLLFSRHYQKFFSEGFAPNLPPEFSPEPTGGLTAPSDPQLYTSTLYAFSSLHLTNWLIKKTLFWPLEQSITFTEENFIYVSHRQKLIKKL